MNTTGLNREIHPLAQSGQLSPAKLKDLRELKQTVDRLAGRPYVSPETVAELLEKFGQEPDIITWGDYFQTEVASAHYQREDREFSLICRTIYFDLISSILIFTGKDEKFYEYVDDNAFAVRQMEPANWTLEDEEKIHLQILANYFREMDLQEKALLDSDYEWFHGFAAARAV